jgi:hypothetical protein
MNDFGPVFWITVAILVIAYVAMEIYRGVSRREGTVLGVAQSDMPMAGVFGCEMDVSLDTGEKVRASASGCVLCRNRFEAGSRVFLLRNKNGWIVDSTNRRACPASKNEKA